MDSLKMVNDTTEDKPINKYLKTVYADVWEQILVTFEKMVRNIFYWSAISTLLVHLVVFLVAVCALRRNNAIRCYLPLFFLIGLAGSLAGGTISSIVFAWTYYNSFYVMPASYAFFAGVSQIILTVIIAYSRILATL